MSEVVMSGTTRKTGRKGPARQLRRDGLVPGIVYGLGENVPFSTEAMPLMKMLDVKGGSNSVIRTKFEGDTKERMVMIKQLDVHPITDVLVHLDLIELDLAKKIKVNVNIEYTGVPKGVKEGGGRLNVYYDKIKIECLPADIPKVIEIPVDEMDIGESIKTGQAPVGENITLLSDKDLSLVSVAMPKEEVEEVVEEEGIGEEPAAEDPEAAKEGE